MTHEANNPGVPPSDAETNEAIMWFAGMSEFHDQASRKYGMILVRRLQAEAPPPVSEGGVVAWRATAPGCGTHLTDKKADADEAAKNGWDVAGLVLASSRDALAERLRGVEVLIRELDEAWDEWLGSPAQFPSERVVKAVAGLRLPPLLPPLEAP